MRRFLLYLLIVYLFHSYLLFAHGFSPHTVVHTRTRTHSIQTVCEAVCTNKQPFLLSYQHNRKLATVAKAVSAGRSSTNCYYEIGFGTKHQVDIACTPNQQFFVVEQKGRCRPCAAHELCVGGSLLGYTTNHSITYLRFVPHHCYELIINPRVTHTEEGRSLSEWSISTHDFFDTLPHLAFIAYPCHTNGKEENFSITVDHLKTQEKEIKGQLTFYKGTQWITPSIDARDGEFWKQYRFRFRTGTCDEHINQIGK